MLEWLKWLIATKEMAELERWRIQWHEHRRWLAEFQHVSSTLDHMKAWVDGTQYRHISDLREEMRDGADVREGSE